MLVWESLIKATHLRKKTSFSVQDYLKNIWMVRKYFLDTYCIDAHIINEDQMPLYRNDSASQKTLSLKSETVFVKENYVLSRERVTCFTQLCSDPKVTLLPEFNFKGKGTRSHLVPPEGVNYQWSRKWSYRIEQMLRMIKKLPNRFNMFTERGFPMFWMITSALNAQNSTSLS